MSLTKIGSIGINTGIAFAGVTTIVTLNTANDALSIGATVNVGSGITLGASGDIFATGVSTVTTLKVGSGVTISSDGDIFATGVTTSTTFVGALTGNVTGNVSGSSGSATGNAGGLTGTPNISVGTIAGSTGTFTGDVDIADKIIHTGDTNTAIRFPAADTISVETDGSERLRVTNNGNLIIAAQNTTNISGNADDIIIGAHDNGTERGITLASTLAGTIRWNDGSDQGVLEYAHADNSFRFSTAATEKLRITSGGNVLIGDTTTGNAFSGGDSLVIGNTSSNTRSGITLVSANDQDGGLYFSDGTSSGSANVQGQIVYDHNGTGMKIYTTASERLRIASDGRIGINDYSPHDSSEMLLVGGPSSDNCTLGIAVNSTTHAGILGFHDTGGSYRGRVQYNHLSDSMQFNTAGSERLRINSSGNAMLRSNSATYLVLGTGGDSGFGATISNNMNWIRGNGDNLQMNCANGGFIAFETNGTERARIQAGGGISFNGDTASDNALDDYEQGDFTFHLNMEGSGNASMSGRVGRYVKIGQTVHIIGGGQFSGDPAGRGSSNAIQFSNLPFVNISTGLGGAGLPFPVQTQTLSSSGMASMNGSQPYQFIGRLDNAATSGRIVALSGSGDQNPQNASLACVNNTQIYAMFTYQTTA